MRPLSCALVFTACLASSISPQSAGDSAGTQVNIERLLDKLQGRLGLSAWTIDVHLVLPTTLVSDEDAGKTVADIVYDTADLTATIRVAQASRREVEDSLLHELVHLELEAWQPPVDPEEEEKTVETITHALLR